MNKFWQVRNSVDEAEILIYGDIVSDKWSDADITAKEFKEELSALKGKNITVRINSRGGDVFQALAIHNAIKAAENITVSIDGLAASAASVIAMAGKKICMADNALMMIHLPSAMLLGLYDESELAKVQEGLSAIKNSTVQVYQARLKDGSAEELMTAETWLSAQEALNKGLIDEITNAIPLTMSNKTLFVNSLKVDTRQFNEEKFKAALGKVKVQEAKTMDEKDIRAEIRAQELTRIKNLQSLKGENSAINALVDTALETGASVEEIQPYINALSKVKTTNAAAMNNLRGLIEDNMTSGAQNVSGGQATPEETKTAQAQQVVDFANKIIGGK